MSSLSRTNLCNVKPPESSFYVISSIKKQVGFYFRPEKRTYFSLKMAILTLRSEPVLWVIKIVAVMDAIVLNLIPGACLYSQTIQLDSVFAKKYQPVCMRKRTNH